MKAEETNGKEKYKLNALKQRLIHSFICRKKKTKKDGKLSLEVTLKIAHNTSTSATLKVSLNANFGGLNVHA